MRRHEGPKRRAEAYARNVSCKPGGSLAPLLAAAYLAGYRSAARARRRVSK